MIKGDLRCITTNSVIRKNGDAIMGAGIAKQALLRHSDLEKRLGKMIRQNGGSQKGNHVYYLGYNLVSFPTKYHWKQDSDIELIRQSARELVALVDIMPNVKRVLLTRPGCGNGNLKWENVKPVIEKIFDDRFIIVQS